MLIVAVHYVGASTWCQVRGSFTGSVRIEGGREGGREGGKALNIVSSILER